MGLPVLYTPRSRETLIIVYNLIRNKFGEKAANKFVTKVEKTIAIIAEQPFIFKATNIDDNVRIGYVTKQTSLFYRVTESSIHLLYFWDNRQEPVS
jgi:plasmid stabilization system protein ParE